jgi:release factor glutamine methyltransferase
MTGKAEKSWTILEILRWTTDYFRTHGVSEPRASTEVLLAHALGLTRLALYLRYDQPLTPEELARFRELVLRRRRGEPVAYLTGHREFWSRDFKVTPAVLIPRPETEVLVSAAIDAAKEFTETKQEQEAPALPSQPPPAAGTSPKTEDRKPKTRFHGLEVGVGSGAVIVTLALELPHFYWVGLDLSLDALHLARENARSLEADGNLAFFQGNLLSALKPEARLALLVANLPYVPQKEWEELPRDIRDFEPAAALLGGADGLDLIRNLTAQAGPYLRPGGCLLLEVGAGQAPQVLALLAATGDYDRIEAVNDYQGIQRVVRARRRPTF